MSQATSQEIATFRDPAGSLRIDGENVLRTVNPRYAAESLRFLRSDLAQRWTDQGDLVASQVVSAEGDTAKYETVFSASNGQPLITRCVGVPSG